MSGVKIRMSASTISKMFLVLFLGLSVFSSGTLAWADYRSNDTGAVKGNVSDHRADVNKHVRHYYRNGRWYKSGWFGMGVHVPVLSAGVYVDTLPPAYTPIVIQGTTYYYGDNTYFSPSPQGGYTVVLPPSH